MELISDGHVLAYVLKPRVIVAEEVPFVPGTDYGLANVIAHWRSQRASQVRPGSGHVEVVGRDPLAIQGGAALECPGSH